MAQYSMDIAARQHSEVEIQSGALLELTQRIRVDLGFRQVVLISDQHVMELWGEVVGRQLKPKARTWLEWVIPPGETSKSAERLQELWTFLGEHRVQRDALVVALGGGVVGDLAGFAAATFARGLDWIQLPTTLMAQVDSSIGGKVAVNLPTGKNLAGTFWQPRQVIVDPRVLSTLPPNEFRSGLAEVVKYGVIEGTGVFKRFSERARDIQRRDERAMEETIQDCCACKVRIVNSDPFDQTGARAWLNYGHTFGHAIEQVSGYGTLTHGEAISMGMVCAARLAQQLGWVTSEFSGQQNALLHQWGLPIQPPTQQHAELYRTMLGDKKNRKGELRLIRPRAMGQLEAVDGIRKDQILAALTQTDG